MTHSEVMGLAREEIGNLYKKFGDSTSMHGVRQVMNKDTLHRRILWTLSVLVGIGWTVFYLTKTVTGFYEYPISTLVTVKYANSLEFPTVTICNMNPIRASKVGNVTKDELLRQLSNQDFWCSQEEIYNVASKFSAEQRKEMGHQIKDMFVGCYFDSRPCSADNFTMVYSERYSNCYSIDHNNTWVVRSPGAKSGLHLILNIESEEYLSPASIRSVVVLLTYREYPFPEIGGLLVEAGRQTLLAIKQEEIRRLSEPHGHCRKKEAMESHHMNPFMSIGYNYSFISCMKTCYQEMVMAHCNCCDGSYPCVKSGTGNANYCTDSHYECVKKVGNGFLQNKRQEDCSSRCPVACDSVTYTPFVTTAALRSVPTKKSSRYGNNVHDESNYVSLIIFFNDMSYQMFTDIPAYDWTKLLSDVGGQMGLWLGLSMITSIEILELLLDTVFLAVKNIFKKVFGK